MPGRPALAATAPGEPPISLRINESANVCKLFVLVPEVALQFQAIETHEAESAKGLQVGEAPVGKPPAAAKGFEGLITFGCKLDDHTGTHLEYGAAWSYVCTTHKTAKRSCRGAWQPC